MFQQDRASASLIERVRDAAGSGVEVVDPILTEEPTPATVPEVEAMLRDHLGRDWGGVVSAATYVVLTTSADRRDDACNVSARGDLVVRGDSVRYAIMQCGARADLGVTSELARISASAVVPAASPAATVSGAKIPGAIAASPVLPSIPSDRPPALEPADADGLTPGRLPLATSSGTFADSALSDDGQMIRSSDDRQWSITSELDGADVQHGAFDVFTRGVGLTVGDGGIQSFQLSTMDTTAGPSQTLSIFAGNSATKSAGTNRLTNYGVLTNVTGGDVNYSFYGAHGQLVNIDAATFGSTVSATGLATLSGGISVPNGRPVTLGDSVSRFAMPNGGTGSIIVGAAAPVAGATEIMQLQNTGAQRFVGVAAVANTTNNSKAIPRFTLYRGAGGGTLAGELAIDDGTMTTAGDMLLYFTGALDFYTRSRGTTFQIRQDGHLHSLPAGGQPALTSCGSSPKLSGTDTAGTITTGATATGCVLTFSSAFANTPTCTVSASDGTGVAYQKTASSLQLTTVRPATEYDYICIGH
ncbi:MAG TPA: hypothetical protein VLT45_02960 [Kofleriaceae bacterium]|nr:hypothetical protein [Kofleriaceae bacterium]